MFLHISIWPIYICMRVCLLAFASCSLMALHQHLGQGAASQAHVPLLKHMYVHTPNSCTWQWPAMHAPHHLCRKQTFWLPIYSWLKMQYNPLDLALHVLVPEHVRNLPASPTLVEFSSSSVILPELQQLLLRSLLLAEYQR